MKVKVTKDQLVGFAWREAGEVVDVDPRRAEQMIRDKAAERVGSVEDSEVNSPPDLASRREIEQRTGRPTVVPPPELTGEMDPVAPRPGEVVTKVGSHETTEVAVDEAHGGTVEVSSRPTDAYSAGVDLAAGAEGVESASPARATGRRPGRPARSTPSDAAEQLPDGGAPPPLKDVEKEKFAAGDAK